METMEDSRFAIWSSDLSSSSFEAADDNKRAELTIGLMHVGPNKKGLYWTEEVLEQIAPMFRGVTYKYDIDGLEGSSHVPKKLFSPHFDIGWTHDSEDGAWYDKKTKTLWTKGEITHPDVLEKLERTTSDGKREINYASMGVFVEEYKCSICGHNTEECDHQRMQKYDGRICYHLPTKITKALHVALTNDPADSEAEIKECIFQELGIMDSIQAQNVKKIQNGTNDKVVQDQNSSAAQPFHSNALPGGLAPSSPMTGRQGPAPSSEEILKDLAERVKTIELQVEAQAQQQMATPEMVNPQSMAPQQQMTQDGMSPQEEQGDQMDMSKGQNTQKATPVNPTAPEKKMEAQDDMPQEQGEDGKLDLIIKLLQQLVGPQVATADVSDELISTSKSKLKPAQSDIKTEHMSPGESISDGAEEDAGNKKNVSMMKKPDKVATADMSELGALRAELADLKGKLEFQDQNIPEFGGMEKSTTVEVADMGGDGRRKAFGEYGAWDAVFNGAQSAARFKR